LLETAVFVVCAELALVLQVVVVESSFGGTGMGCQTGIAESQVTITVNRAIEAQFDLAA